MIFGLPLADFFRIRLSIIGLIATVVLLPFAIRRFRPQPYRGPWQVADNPIRRSGCSRGLIPSSSTARGRSLFR